MTGLHHADGRWVSVVVYRQDAIVFVSVSGDGCYTIKAGFFCPLTVQSFQLNAPNLMRSDVGTVIFIGFVVLSHVT